ncbi:unnamed protein product, partial [Symbiodinium necroappetens]
RIPLALPVGVVPPSLLEQGNEAVQGVMFGPSTTLSVPALVEEEDGGETPAASPLDVLVVDFEESAGQYLEPYDPLVLPDPVPFSAEAPSAFPDGARLVALCRAWVRTVEAERTAFYSAFEAEQGEGCPALSEKQEALEQKVSQGAAAPALLPAHRQPFPFADRGRRYKQGRARVTACCCPEPPPRTRPEPAMAPQAPTDIATGGGLSSRASAKREKLQAELAMQAGNFMLAVAQSGHRRMYPTEAVPRNLEELRREPRRFTFSQYLERHGGYQHQKDLGLIMYMVCQVSDMLLAGSEEGALDLLSLLMVCLEQASLDHGRFEVAYTLSLFAEPPSQVFSNRGAPQNPRLRAFAPLCPPTWATTAFAFLKETDSILARRTEASGGATSSGQTAQDEQTAAAKKAPRWSLSLFYRIVRTKTPFGVFLGSLLHLSPAPFEAPSKSLFPLPLPFFGIFRALPPHMGSAARSRIGVRRAVFVTVAALNYLNNGLRPVAHGPLRRPPSELQAKALGYIERLVKACGAVEAVDLVSASRRSSKLAACLEQGLLLDQQVAFDALHPYRSLDPSRLKLAGRANWDPSDFLDDLFFLPYREPQALHLHSVGPPAAFEVPDLSREVPSRVLALAKLWDSQGLLRLSASGPESPDQAVRVFNAVKNLTTDRQIGDRRGRNRYEGVLRGGSSQLPCGPALCDLLLNPRTHSFRISVCDRKDFYHQLLVPPRRCLRNLLCPALRLEDLTKLDAFRLHPCLADTPDALAPGGAWPEKVYPCFSAILQGDALGVEFACSCHSNLLSSFGLLGGSSRLLGGRPFPSGAEQDLIEGLVIDDWFSVACQPLGEVGPSSSGIAFARAQYAYIFGSSDKDVYEPPSASIAGAEVDSSQATRELGLALVGPAKEKRIALAALTLEAARLPRTSDSLHLSLTGAWVSACLFRRPFMSVLDRVFRLVPVDNVRPDRPKAFDLPRRTANELVVLSALSFLLTCDVSAPWSHTVFATDSSTTKGAIVEAEVGPEVTSLLWRSDPRAASSGRLLSKDEAVLHQIDLDREPAADCLEPGPRRPPACRFHFLEVWGSAGALSEPLVALGWTAGPRLDPSISCEYDPSSSRVFEWICFLVEKGRVDAIGISLPLATFSWAVRPPVRSVARPFGWAPLDEKVRRANRCAHLALAVLRVCRLHGLPAVLLHPVASFATSLPAWVACAKASGVERLPFGWKAPPLHLLTVGLPAISEVLLSWRFDSLRPAGSADARGTAVLQAAALLDLGLARRSASLAACALDAAGLESVLVNDLALSAPWSVTKVWSWPCPVHINILESSCVCRLLGIVAKRGFPVRFASLCDSNVSRCAITRGRSPSRGLSKVMRRIAAACLAYGLYPVVPFCPTRLMPADAPSRNAPLEPPVASVLSHICDVRERTCLSGLPTVRRWAANWLRLFFGLCRFHLPAGELYRGRGSAFRTFVPSPLRFDSTLGFPGEGPLQAFLWPLLAALASPSWCLPVCAAWASLLVFRVGAVGPVASSHGLLCPRNPGDLLRKNRRDPGGLPEGRVVEATTQRNRDALWGAFLLWLDKAGIDRALFTSVEGIADIDSINCVFGRYGRDLYAAGRPFAHYSETLNAFSAKVPKYRRLLQPAWDIAFSWKREEPGRHHTALPWQVLLSLVSAAFTWGWPRVAGALALAWGGLLRIGEVLQACRQDLTLPSDVRHTVDYAYLTIRDPKTRYHAARHQAVRVDQPDILEIISVAYGKLGRKEKLWVLSGQTLRVRFKQLCQALLLPCEPGGKLPALELSSLRAGGATWLMMQGEDSELVRRRGRWLSHRIMEIYVQEVSSIQLFNCLPEASKDRVFAALAVFRDVLSKVNFFGTVGILPTMWYRLLAAGSIADA